MLSVSDAIAQLVAAAPRPPESEPVPLCDAVGRVLAAPVESTIDVPPAANSAMDGYAIRAADWTGPDSPMPVGARLAAGQAPGTHAPGTLTRIFTGAELPAGADAIVMQENTRTDDHGTRVTKRPRTGDHVRPRGQDIGRGDRILDAGHRLRAQDIGLVASVGIAEVPVHRRLRVAVVSNGDELVEPGRPTAPGQIYNSNRYLLGSLLQGWGFEFVDAGIAADRPDAIAAQFSRAAESADVVLSCGGVSVGEEDHVKGVVESLGRLDLWKIAMKPGKPLAFGVVGETPFIGLPGNPASALVTALIVARPFLLACQGAAATVPQPFAIPAAFRAPAGERQVYHRARRGAQGLETYPNPSSGVLRSTAWAQGLAIQPPGKAIAPGDPVDFLPWSALS